MSEHLIFGLALIVVLGVAAQVLASRLRVPSILFLLLFGVLAGPVTGLVNPDETFGDLLFPFVELAVAIILFEGGLSLRLRDLHGTRGVLRNLVTIGALISWGVTAAAAHWLLGLSWPVALLFGAILVVTGPTVIMPLLRQVRPKGRVATILRWEGIVIDPVGATLAVLTFEALFGAATDHPWRGAIMGLAKTIATGGLLGLLGSWLVMVGLRRRWVPEMLDNSVTLAVVVLVFALCEHFQPTSGLLGTTVMGIGLANQQRVLVSHITEFKEHLGLLLIAILFIVLGARLELTALALTGPKVAFLLVLFLIGRPLGVWASTWRSDLTNRERLFLAFVAPRGIVAAAVASVFALQLAQAGYEEPTDLVSLAFLVIFATVAVYGLAAGPLAVRLGLSDPNPQGVLFIGANRWNRLLASVLNREGFRVLMIDSNPENTLLARQSGLDAVNGDALDPALEENLDLGGIGRMLALTSNDEVNALASLRFIEDFGRDEVYQLPRPERPQGANGHLRSGLRGKTLFRTDLSYAVLSRHFANGAVIRVERLTDDHDLPAMRRRYGDRAIVLFVLDGKALDVIEAGERINARRGSRLIIMLLPEDEPEVQPEPTPDLETEPEPRGDDAESVPPPPPAAEPTKI